MRVRTSEIRGIPSRFGTSETLKPDKKKRIPSLSILGENHKVPLACYKYSIPFTSPPSLSYIKKLFVAFCLCVRMKIAGVVIMAIVVLAVVMSSCEAQQASNVRETYNYYNPQSIG